MTSLTSFFGFFFCQTPKKKKKESPLLCLMDESGLEIFCQTPKNKKVQVLRIFIVRVIQSITGIYQCCSIASVLKMYISHTSGYRDQLID